MEPNIYDYATTEYAQDAFIAWMCANYHSSNSARQELAKMFISLLCDGKEPCYDRVEVNKQVSKIDVLVTLYNKDDQANEQAVHYIIVEDKTYSSEHDNQVQKYIQTLHEKVEYNQISVAYYKTGHIIVQHSDFIKDGSNWVQDSKPSEKNRLDDLEKFCKDLSSFRIIKLEDVDEFFHVNLKDVEDSESEIIKDYSEHIHKLQTKMELGEFTNAKDANDPLWVKSFDEGIGQCRKSFPNLLFHLGHASGHYWELCITDKNQIVGKAPIANLRSNVFTEVPYRLRFLLNPGWDKSDETLFNFVGGDANKIQNHKSQFYEYSLQTDVPLTQSFIVDLIKKICDAYLNAIGSNGTVFSAQPTNPVGGGLAD